MRLGIASCAAVERFLGRRLGRLRLGDALLGLLRRAAIIAGRSSLLALPIALLAALDSARRASAVGHGLPASGVSLEQPVDGGRILAARQLALPASLRVLPQQPDVDHA